MVAVLQGTWGFCWLAWHPGCHPGVFPLAHYSVSLITRVEVAKPGEMAAWCYLVTVSSQSLSASLGPAELCRKNGWLVM